MSETGHTRPFGDVRSMSELAPESGRPCAILRCRRSADFVAEVRCKLFWSVIPSLRCDSRRSAKLRIIRCQLGMHPTQIKNRSDLADRMIVRHRLIETK